MIRINRFGMGKTAQSSSQFPNDSHFGGEKDEDDDQDVSDPLLSDPLLRLRGT